MKNNIKIEIDLEIQNITWNPEYFYTSYEDYTGQINGVENLANLASSGSFNFNLDYYDGTDGEEF